MSWEEGGGRQEGGLLSSECSGQQEGCMFTGIPQAFQALSPAHQAGSVFLQLSQHQAPLLVGTHIQS